MIAEEVSRVVEKHADRRGALISVLEEVQQKYGYLSPEALQAVAEKSRRSLVDVYSVATFYRAFTLTPRGKHYLCACVGTACHVRGAPNVVQELKTQLQVEPGETTPDREFTFETVNCLGACALGPMVTVDGHYNSNVSTAKVRRILDKARMGTQGEEPASDERNFPITVRCPKCRESLMDASAPIDGHPSIHLETPMNGSRGWVRLSSLYGSHNCKSQAEIPLDSIAPLHCTHCSEELHGAGLCPECGSPMAVMLIEDAGILQLCTRRGCNGHALDLNEPEIAGRPSTRTAG